MADGIRRHQRDLGLPEDEPFVLLDLTEIGLRIAVIDGASAVIVHESLTAAIRTELLDRLIADHLVRAGRVDQPETPAWAAELLDLTARGRVRLQSSDGAFIMGREHVRLFRVTRRDVDESTRDVAVEIDRLWQEIAEEAPRPVRSVVITAGHHDWPGWRTSLTQTAPVPVITLDEEVTAGIASFQRAGASRGTTPVNRLGTSPDRSSSERSNPPAATGAARGPDEGPRVRPTRDRMTDPASAASSTAASSTAASSTAASSAAAATAAAAAADSMAPVVPHPAGTVPGADPADPSTPTGDAESQRPAASDPATLEPTPIASEAWTASDPTAAAVANSSTGGTTSASPTAGDHSPIAAVESTMPIQGWAAGTPQSEPPRAYSSAPLDQPISAALNASAAQTAAAGPPSDNLPAFRPAPAWEPTGREVDPIFSIAMRRGVGLQRPETRRKVLIGGGAVAALIGIVVVSAMSLSGSDDVSPSATGETRATAPQNPTGQNPTGQNPTGSTAPSAPAYADPRELADARVPAERYSPPPPVATGGESQSGSDRAPNRPRPRPAPRRSIPNPIPGLPPILLP
ncbi:hypothetical protein [Gordonia soli]|uniref:Uncharacterized protein n=1 Tax=Gordonia soli NBRC 108243 TaxID=1223545 RepID=M0QGC0_9ACTN|nr:hypothetical protein [Gordonia soli]GAC67494.1 hypothetical protein GS4_08_00780 [Gordonia soli NBRC 108243]